MRAPNRRPADTHDSTGQLLDESGLNYKKLCAEPGAEGSLNRENETFVMDEEIVESLSAVAV